MHLQLRPEHELHGNQGGVVCCVGKVARGFIVKRVAATCGSRPQLRARTVDSHSWNGSFPPGDECPHHTATSGTKRPISSWRVRWSFVSLTTCSTARMERSSWYRQANPHIRKHRQRSRSAPRSSRPCAGHLLRRLGKAMGIAPAAGPRFRSTPDAPTRDGAGLKLIDQMDR